MFLPSCAISAEAMRLKALMEWHLKLLEPETEQYTIEINLREDQRRERTLRLPIGLEGDYEMSFRSDGVVQDLRRF